jgi:precorrin-2 dehydrogenase / sirohydrochlorin ferrochelatase
MSHFYPIVISLVKKKVVIIGGGKVAERKFQGLQQSEAIIEIISPSLSKYLQEKLEEHAFTWRKKEIAKEDMEDAFLIIAATNNRTINESIKEWASPLQLLNIADDPDASNFLVPSVIKRGKLLISVSTSGASPILASKIRQQLEKEFDDRYTEYLEFLHNCRRFIINCVQDSAMKKQLLTAIVDSSFLASDRREEEFLNLYNKIGQTDGEAD